MLFNSHIFIFVFLPVTLTGYFALGKYSHRLAAVWLAAASLFFYGWWSPAYVSLLVASILFNYSIGMALSREHMPGLEKRKKRILILGIAVNLSLLAYYKYANFFLTSTGYAGSSWVGKIILPLGISFFTFTQIAFLVDASRGEVRERDFIHYGLFVTYFPHLIAGPILHHKEIMPQFGRRATYVFSYENCAVGLTIFSMGLFKKVVLADSIGPFAQVVFEAASRGQTLTFIEAWAGVISYSLQIYLDFSGYTDMAIGISRLFGIRLPLNFNSPYQAINIIEFWRRWHMTLSRFLRDYLYIPLGGNRRGIIRRYVNIMITMLLGGLWHGAGWTFVIWGGLHGLYLLINHAWHEVRRMLGHDMRHSAWLGRTAGRGLTFVAVVIAWVFFRAVSISACTSVFQGMAGLNGVVMPEAWQAYSGHFGRWLSGLGFPFGATPYLTNAVREPFLIAGLLAIVWCFPNTQQIMGKFHPALGPSRNEERKVWRWLQWMPRWRWAVGSAVLMIVSIVMLDKVSEFLYFQF